MNRLQSALNDQLLDPRHAGLLSVIKAARNGFVYGAKVRFPHALVYVVSANHVTLSPHNIFAS